MRDWMQCHGVPADHIHVESASLSTRQNALFSAPLLNELQGRRVLLTSDYHMFRARRVFAKLGYPVLAQPVPDAIKRAGSRTARWGIFLELVLETTKIGYYYLRGWI